MKTREIDLENCRNLHNYLKRKLQYGSFRRVGEVLISTLDEHLVYGDKENLLKTCLIITKGFKENEFIKTPRENIVNNLKPKA